jgi:hypothetical protein
MTAKQPFVNWLHTVDPTSKDIGLSNINREHYLLFVEQEPYPIRSLDQ